MAPTWIRVAFKMDHSGSQADQSGSQNGSEWLQVDQSGSQVDQSGSRNGSQWLTRWIRVAHEVDQSGSHMDQSGSHVDQSGSRGGGRLPFPIKKIGW